MKFSRIMPLSEFKKSTNTCIADIKRFDQPVLITQHGRGAFVVHDIESYKRLEELAEIACQNQAIHSALEEFSSRSEI